MKIFINQIKIPNHETFTKSKWLVAVFIFLGGSAASSAQSLKDVFNNSESPLVYLGIDFSQARLLDVGNASDIRGRLYGSINNLVIDEPKNMT